MPEPLGYMSGPDEPKQLRWSHGVAIAEAVCRWVAFTSIIGLHWQWPTLQSWLAQASFLVGFFAVPLWAIVLFASFLASRRQASPFRWRRRLIVIAVCASLALSAMLKSWPFYVAFAVSRPFLNRLADQAALGKNVTGWHWAGVWLITDVHVEADGSVGLYFDRDMNGWCGVVRYASPTSTPVGSNNGRHFLGGRWELVDED